MDDRHTMSRIVYLWNRKKSKQILIVQARADKKQILEI